MCGMPGSSPGRRGRAAPTAPAGRSALGTTTWPPNTPDLAAQWHPTKNGDLRPQDVVAGSRRKVWWQCPKGHVWQAAIASRAGGGAGCPVCAGKQVVPGENDLATLFPPAGPAVGPGEEWGPHAPAGLLVQQPRRLVAVPAGAQLAGGHQCPGLGSDCPYCAGRKVLPGFNDLATRDPAVAPEWDPDLNGALTPQMVTAGAHKKAWWRCPENHVWKAVVYSRTGPKHCGCPVCAGKVSQRNQVRYPIPTGEPRGLRRLSQDGAGSREETLAKTKTL